MNVDADVLVVGGGPVGLAAAVEARLRGLEVIVVEPRAAPVDKACGEGLMPSAVQRLRRLGVVPPGRPFVGIRYVSGGWRAEARFAAAPGLGVRRTVLQEALLERAEDLGAHLVRARVDSVEQDSHGVAAAGLRARYLVAADGLHSPVRRGLGLQPPRVPEAGRYGLRRHVAAAPWTDHVEVHWSSRAEAYVTPVAEDLVGVAVLGPARTGFEQALAELPELAARLRGKAFATQVRGAGPLRQRASRVVVGRVLLAGDAAGYVDALTGEGIAVGLASARAAVDALARDRPEDYAGEWRRATRRYRVATTALLAVTSQPLSRAALVPVAAHWPGGFARAVATIS